MNSPRRHRAAECTRIASCAVGAFLLAVLMTHDARAQGSDRGDPYDARFVVRGVEPYRYLGYDEFADQVLSAVVHDRLELPGDLTEGEIQVRSPSFVVQTRAALNPWQVRVLAVRVETGSTNGPLVEVRLRWPSDARILSDFPFEPLRLAFETSGLEPDSPEWLEQRNRLWPDIATTADQVVVSERVIDAMTCPQLLAELRELRDAPPALEILPADVDLGETDDDEIIVVTDGWSVTVTWNGGPSRFGGGRAFPDQASEFGATLLRIVGEAQQCGGVTRTVQ